MKRVVLALTVVIGIILFATYLMTGTGLLTGTGGMFVRVLIGFGLLFISLQIAFHSNHEKADLDQQP